MNRKTHVLAKFGFLFLLLVLLVPPASATLHDRGPDMVYDDTLNITWLKDWGYAKTSGYDIDGMFTWPEAQAWAASLRVGGVDGWRLPKLLDPNAYCIDSTGCRTSEFGVLFYDTFQGQAVHDYTEARNQAAVAMFENIQHYYYYLADTFSGDGTMAWRFDPRYGAEAPYWKDHWVFATGVHAGDVGAMNTAAVPEPGVWLLLLAGLAVIVRKGLRAS